MHPLIFTVVEFYSVGLCLEAAFFFITVNHGCIKKKSSIDSIYRYKRINLVVATSFSETL